FTSVIVLNPFSLANVQKFRCGSNAADEQMVTCTSARDVKKMTLGVINVLQIGVIGHGFDSLLQGDHFIVTGHDDNRPDLKLLDDRSHDVHMLGIDKSKLAFQNCDGNLAFDPHVPFLLAYDYLITYIDWFVGERLGRSARGMIILDEKPEFHAEVE